MTSLELCQKGSGTKTCLSHLEEEGFKKITLFFGRVTHTSFPPVTGDSDVTLIPICLYWERMIIRRFVFSPAPMWWLTAVHNAGSKGSDVLFWPLQTSGTHPVQLHTSRTNTHTYKTNNFFFKGTFEQCMLLYCSSQVCPAAH